MLFSCALVCLSSASATWRSQRSLAGPTASRRCGIRCHVRERPSSVRSPITAGTASPAKKPVGFASSAGTEGPPFAVKTLRASLSPQAAASANPCAVMERQTATTSLTKMIARASTGGRTNVPPSCPFLAPNAASRGEHCTSASSTQNKALTRPQELRDHKYLDFKHDSRCFDSSEMFPFAQLQRSDRRVC